MCGVGWRRAVRVAQHFHSLHLENNDLVLGCIPQIREECTTSFDPTFDLITLTLMRARASPTLEHYLYDNSEEKPIAGRSRPSLARPWLLLLLLITFYSWITITITTTNERTTVLTSFFEFGGDYGERDARVYFAWSPDLARTGFVVVGGFGRVSISIAALVLRVSSASQSARLTEQLVRWAVRLTPYGGRVNFTQRDLVLKYWQQTSSELMDLLNDENVAPNDADREALETALLEQVDPFDLAEIDRVDAARSDSVTIIPAEWAEGTTSTSPAGLYDLPLR
ncbi:hypothetical protein C8F01DRAFT_1280652 [Mycena amicta]|nr:hypothetical protein C8F01DRAFT_1280652 [Mycena amicta]